MFFGRQKSRLLWLLLPLLFFHLMLRISSSKEKRTVSIANYFEDSKIDVYWFDGTQKEFVFYLEPLSRRDIETFDGHLFLAVLNNDHIRLPEASVTIKENVNQYSFGPNSEREYMQAGLDCFLSKRSVREPQPRLNHPIVNYVPGEPVINIKNALDVLDLLDLENLYQCIRITMPNHIHDRPFDSLGYGGGNNVTYISGFLTTALTELSEHIKDLLSLAADAAGWRPHPKHLGIRCIEVLSYGPGKELLLHKDGDSIYTVSFMLSAANSFEGGEFVINPVSASEQGLSLSVDGTALHLLHSAPNQGDAIMFDSNAPHGVQPISSGERKVLVIELWVYEDVAPHHFRPKPQINSYPVKKASLLKVSLPTALALCSVATPVRDTKDTPMEDTQEQCFLALLALLPSVFRASLSLMRVSLLFRVACCAIALLAVLGVVLGMSFCCSRVVRIMAKHQRERVKQSDDVASQAGMSSAKKTE